MTPFSTIFFMENTDNICVLLLLEAAVAADIIMALIIKTVFSFMSRF